MKTLFLAVAFLIGVCIFGVNAPSNAAPLRNWPSVTLGQHDGTVRVLQALLAAHGYKVSADGFLEGQQKKPCVSFSRLINSSPLGRQMTRLGKP